MDTVADAGLPPLSVPQSGGLPAVQAAWFDFDAEWVRAWRIVGEQQLEMIAEVESHTGLVRLAARHANASGWVVTDAALLGQYIMFTADFDVSVALRERVTGEAEITRNPYLTLIALDVTTLAEEQALFTELERLAEGRLIDRNGLAFPASDGVPNDPNYAASWQLAKLELEPVWRRFGFNPHEGPGRLGHRAVIAVVDNGTGTSDLQFWTNAGEIPGNGIDDDENGFIDDVTGWNFFARTNDVSYSGGHGSQVTRIAGAIANNGTGTASPATSAEIMRVIVYESVGPSHFTVLSGIGYAIDNDADVVNLSLVSSSSTMFRRTIERGIEKDIIVVAAAGNNGRDLADITLWPAKLTLSNLLTVGFSTSSDTRASGSNYSDIYVDLFAPGTASSYVAPLVASTVALLRALKPDATHQEIVSAIMQGVHVNPDLEALCISGGRLNVKRSVEILLGIDLDEEPMVDTDGDGIPDWWEELHFGGPTNAVADAVLSGNGMTVYGAYRAGTDPWDPECSLRIEHVLWQDEAVHLQWRGSTNSGVQLPFVVQFSPALLPSAWTNLARVERAGGMTQQWIRTEARAEAPGFYRIVVPLE